MWPRPASSSNARRPDVVVVNISLSGSSGLELIKRIKAQNAGVRMLVSSIHDEGVYAERALCAGALGYVNKREATRTIIDAIRRVRGGRVYLSERMSDRLLSRAVGGNEPSFGESPVDSLSDRELDVFESIGRGEATREIAARLHLERQDRRDLSRANPREAGAGNRDRARAPSHGMDAEERMTGRIRSIPAFRPPRRPHPFVQKCPRTA